MHILASHQTLLLAFGDGTTPVLGWWLLEVVPFGTGGLSALLLSAGLVGSAILDRFFGGDEGGDGDDDDPLMNGGGLDGGMDDPFGDDDDMGGMDDPFGDDPFGDGDEGGNDTDELDHRLSELESEVTRLSSTVNTVRSENTEISNTVDDIGENVRKLLDNYEMVTRGIHPFVDDVQPGGGAGGFENGSLGLFDSDDGDEDDEELDDSIASADAEGFFDDELLDEDDDDEFDDLDDEFEDEGMDGFDDGEVTEEMETEVSDSGGKSFSELKEEYESGDAEWADEGLEGADEEDEDDFENEGDFEFGEDADDEFEDDFDDEFGDDLLGEEVDAVPVETDEMLFESDEEEAVLAADGAALTADTPDEGVDADASETADDAEDDSGFEFGTTADAPDEDAAEDDEHPKPYLTTLPDAYIGDLLVIEWLEYLVEQSDVADAARAIRYYERIDWVGGDVARTLEEFLVGFGDVNVAETERPGTSELSLSHHVRSLEYVQALAGPMPGRARLSRGLRRSRGGDDGI